MNIDDRLGTYWITIMVIGMVLEIIKYYT